MRNEDAAFLEYIEKKCHGWREVKDRYRLGRIDDYHDVRLTEDELQRILALVADTQNDLLLLPNSTTFGFGGPAFAVVRAEKQQPSVPTELTWLAHFTIKQLPEGWTWKRMVKHFPNQQQTSFFDLRFSTSASDYDY